VEVEVWRYGSLGRAPAESLEEANGKLKKLLAETVLDAATLKEMLAKNF
jgi:hypothetical protein